MIHVHKLADHVDNDRRENKLFNKANIKPKKIKEKT